MNKASEELLKAWQAEGIDYGDTGSSERYIGKRRIRCPKHKSAVMVVVLCLMFLNTSNKDNPQDNQPDSNTQLYASSDSYNQERELFRVDRQNKRTVIPPSTKPTPAPPSWDKPLTSYQITSCYGPRWGRLHDGIDFAARPGTPILSVGSGKIIQAGWKYSGYGYTVTVDHGGGWKTIYAHASKVLVSSGQWVSSGQKIALVGSTGYSTGPHLHFGVYQYRFGQWTNPKPWLKAHGVVINGC